jgi:YVTN family beta-propeller protein
MTGAAGALTAMGGCARGERVSYNGQVFVANFDGRALAVVDLAAFAAVRHIPLEDAPRLVITHPALPFVYAAAGDRMIQVHSDRLEMVKSVRLPAPATELAFAADGQMLYALLPEANAIVKLSARDMKEAARIALPAEPGRFAFTANGKWVAATLPSTGALALVDLAQGKVRDTANIGGQPWTVRFRKDEQMLVVGDRAGRAAVMVDLAAAPRVAVRVPLGLEPLQLREKADGGQMFFSGPGSDSVVTLYPFHTEVGSTTLAGRAPGVMAISESPEYLFIANPPTSTMTILNVATQRVMATVDVGRDPVHISVTPDDEYVLVLNHASGDMSVIDIPALAGPALANRRNKAAALLTQVAVGSGPVSATVRLS